MNKRIRELGLSSGMLNYVDHETPRHYFLESNADEMCLEKFAELLVLECADFIEQDQGSGDVLANRLKEHFGVNSEKEVILPDDQGHPCPYSIELHDDYDSLCHCNEEETEQCRMDI